MENILKWLKSLKGSEGKDRKEGKKMKRRTTAHSPTSFLGYSPVSSADSVRRELADGPESNTSSTASILIKTKSPNHRKWFEWRHSDSQSEWKDSSFQLKDKPQNRSQRSFQPTNNNQSKNQKRPSSPLSKSSQSIPCNSSAKSSQLQIIKSAALSPASSAKSLLSSLFKNGSSRSVNKVVDSNPFDLLGEGPWIAPLELRQRAVQESKEQLIQEKLKKEKERELKKDPKTAWHSQYSEQELKKILSCCGDDYQVW